MNGNELRIVEAAQELCKLITEEDAHILSYVMGYGNVSPEEVKKWKDFTVKLIDLGQAVQEYET